MQSLLNDPSTVLGMMLALFIAGFLAMLTLMAGTALYFALHVTNAAYLFVQSARGRPVALWPMGLLTALPAFVAGLAGACICGLRLSLGATDVFGWVFAVMAPVAGAACSGFLLSGHVAAVGLGRGLSSGLRKTGPKTAIVGGAVVVISVVASLATGQVYWFPYALVVLGILGGGARDRLVLTLGGTATVLYTLGGVAQVVAIAALTLASGPRANPGPVLFPLFILVLGALLVGLPFTATVGVWLLALIEGPRRTRPKEPIADPIALAA